MLGEAMNYSFKKDRKLIDPNQISLLMKEEILKPFLREETPKREKLDPDWLKNNFKDATKRTEFFESAPLIYYSVGKVSPSFDELHDAALAHKDEIGSSVLSIFKTNDAQEQEKIKTAIAYLGAKSYQELRQNKVLKRYDRVVDFMRNSISRYRNAIPEGLRTEGSKPNTADVILIFKGNKDDVIEYVKNLDIDSGEAEQLFKDGVIGNNKVSFIQVSMKKEGSGARIGKVFTKVLEILGFSYSNVRGFTPTAVVQEGLSEDTSSVWGWIKRSFSWIYDKIKNIGNKILSFVQAKDVYKNIFYQNSSELLSVLESPDPLFLSKLQEERDLNEQVKIKIDQLEYVSGEIFKSITKYHQKLVDMENDKKNKNSFFKLNFHNVFIPDIDYMKMIKNNLIKNPTRENFLPLTKLNANRSALEFFVLFVEKAYASKTVKELFLSFVTLSREIAVESSFGDTLLPLWKFYGGDKGIEFLGFRQNKTTGSETPIKNKMPIFIFEMSQTSTKSTEKWNVTKLFSIDTNKITFDSNQEYFLIEMTSESGSRFSFKMEANKKVSYNKAIKR